jgi:hypothetical protein
MKRSVVSIQKVASPLEILHLAKKAYDYANAVNNQYFKLSYASLVSLLYITGMRISEALSLRKFQFRKRLSMKKREFIVIENVMIEKSKGKVRNIVIYPKDPLAKPTICYLDTLEPEELLYPFTRMTAYNVIRKISNGEIFPHWFRAQRDTFLAWRWGKEERKRIMGWSSRKSFRDAEDRYAFLGWLWYADDLADVTDSYWANEKIPEDLQAWLDSLDKVENNEQAEASSISN